MKMKLLRLVPLFVLLVTMVNLMPPAYASINLNSSKSNSYQVACCGTIQDDDSQFQGIVTILFTSTLGKIQTKPVVEKFTFTATTKAPAPTSKVVVTDLPADGYNVSITFTVTNLGSPNLPTACNNLVGNTQPNTPVTIPCKDQKTGASVMVTIITGTIIRF